MLLNTRLAVWFGPSVVLCEVLLFSFGDHFSILLRQMATLKKTYTRRTRRRGVVTTEAHGEVAKWGYQKGGYSLNTTQLFVLNRFTILLLLRL